MAKFKDKVSTLLDEGRMLVLGAQVLLGLQLRLFFENGYDRLPIISKLLLLAGLAMMVATIGLLISPSAYHRIVERGEDTKELHRFASRVITVALLPFAFGLSVNVCVAVAKVAGWKLGLAAGVAGLALALSFWYGLELLALRQRAEEIEEEKRMSEQAEEVERQGSGGGGTKLTNKIKHVLTEARVVLPGAQALLGFLFLAVLTDSFERLPPLSKYVHVASIGFIALTVVLLMTPAAYHRIVERGDETEHFHRFASRMVIASLVPLALGLAAAVYVVVQRALDSQLVAVVSALVTLALFWELWFGLPLYRRTQKKYAD